MKSDIHQFLYISQLAPDFGSEAVRSILQVSREHNRAAELSGALLFDGARFVQLLEGTEDVLHALTQRIAVDRRHVHFVVLHDSPSAAGRLCNGWSAGYVEGEQVDAFAASVGSGGDLIAAFSRLLARADVI